MNTATFALVDCNNFYASCERLFRPDLRGKPIVVLSNNDGCVIARSKEAKALGVKMGVPYYQIKDLVVTKGILVFSSNYALYADISSRVMRTLEQMAPGIEIYSIDEAFLDISAIHKVMSFMQFGHQLRERVCQWTGITVGVGIGPTKTLAKLANYAAKKHANSQGVVDFTAPGPRHRFMTITPVGEVWGIGRKLERHLSARGITTAAQLAACPPKMIKRDFSIVLERTVRELNGESCHDLDTLPASKKQIVCSRSFGERIRALPAMQEAVAGFVARGCEKLRHEQQAAKHITVFMRTNTFNAQAPQYRPSLGFTLEVPTDDTRDMLRIARHLVAKIWIDGYDYAKAGVMLSDFYAPGTFQVPLFDAPVIRRNSKSLMQTIDTLKKSGASIFFAGQGIKQQQQWQMKRERLSPAYTTQWKDLPRVR